MNTSTFTTNQLRNIVTGLVLDGRAVTENICGYDSTLCEVTENFSAELEINSVDEDKGLLDIKWSLLFDESYEGAGDGWTFRYQTIVEIPVAKFYTEKLTS